MSSQQTVNISDVAEWLGSPLDDDGQLIYSVLTIPVYNANKQILGVAQMINKVGRNYLKKAVTVEKFICQHIIILCIGTVYHNITSCWYWLYQYHLILVL